MIQKIIHNVRLGGKPKPESVEKKIESWKKSNPDYEIKEWNETDFDFSAPAARFAREAYEEKKYAFASDHIRRFARVREGGIYMGTDVECCKSFDDLPDLRAVLGFKGEYLFSTGAMPAEKEHPFFVALLDDYRDKPFVRRKRGKKAQDLTSNCVRMTSLFMRRYRRHFVKNAKITGGGRLFRRHIAQPGVCAEFRKTEYGCFADLRSLYHSSLRRQPDENRVRTRAEILDADPIRLRAARLRSVWSRRIRRGASLFRSQRLKR